MSNKIYVGKAKVQETQYGNILKVNLILSQIPKGYIREFENSEGEIMKAINLDIVKLKEPDQRGNTYTVKVDTWKPEKKKEAVEETVEDSNLPF